MFEYMEPRKKKLIYAAVAAAVIVSVFVVLSVFYVKVIPDLATVNWFEAMISGTMDIGHILDSTARTVTGGVDNTVDTVSNVSEGVTTGVTDIQQDIDTVVDNYEPPEDSATVDNTGNVGNSANTDNNAAAGIGNVGAGSSSTDDDDNANKQQQDKGKYTNPQPEEQPATELSQPDGHTTPIPDNIQEMLEKRREQIRQEKDLEDALAARADGQRQQQETAEPTVQEEQPAFNHFEYDVVETFDINTAITGTVQRVEGTNTIVIHGPTEKTKLTLAGVNQLDHDEPRYTYAMSFLRTECPVGTTLVYEGSVDSSTVWCYGIRTADPPQVPINRMLVDYGYTN